MALWHNITLWINEAIMKKYQIMTHILVYDRKNNPYN